MKHWMLALLWPCFVYAQQVPVRVTIKNYDGKMGAGERVTLRNVKTNAASFCVGDAGGICTLYVQDGADYQVYFDSFEGEQKVDMEKPIAIPKGMVGTLELQLLYSLPTQYTFESIQFESGKAVLSASSYPSLKQLAEVMKRKKEMIIELAGHTDNEGSDAKNQLLSEERALAVKNYLVAQGIHANRIKTVGYGPSRPIADNTTEAGRKQNRRTELTILRP